MVSCRKVKEGAGCFEVGLHGFSPNAVPRGAVFKCGRIAEDDSLDHSLSHSLGDDEGLIDDLLLNHDFWLNWWQVLESELLLGGCLAESGVDGGLDLDLLLLRFELGHDAGDLQVELGWERLVMVVVIGLRGIDIEVNGDADVILLVVAA